MSGIMVGMPVKCMGEECMRCEYLAVRVRQERMYGGDTEAVVNSLECSHLSRCERLAGIVEETMRRKKRPVICNGPGNEACYECEETCSYR